MGKITHEHITDFDTVFETRYTQDEMQKLVTALNEAERPERCLTFGQMLDGELGDAIRGKIAGGWTSDDLVGWLSQREEIDYSTEALSAMIAGVKIVSR